MKLQEWANEHEPDDKMRWKKAYWSQVMFVRDYIPRAFFLSNTERNDLIVVDGSHTSKSIECPVYFINLIEKHGIQIWMRDNFYDWNVSVKSENPIVCDFMKSFHDENYPYCFCQGMTDKKYKPYKENNKEFTICIDNTYDLYVFCRCLAFHLRGEKV
ncbi:MAG TPA: hypothetical protein VMX17_11825 [Candidatus Glassbacteria bacterium]|nr:hypothetical protein [Candidatus Glassbacteria bacterium]